MIKNKKSNIGFSNIASIIIALIGGLAIISIAVYIMGAFGDPNKIEDGLKCRLVIQASATLKEATAGLSPEKIIDACPTLERTMPIRDKYPTIGRNINTMTADQLKQVVLFDFAELINNAWWISGEGDRADYLINNLRGIFLSDNDCYVVYAIRIDTPKKFTSISETDLIAELKKLTRADIKGGALKGDIRRIMDYITLDGKGAGVFLKTEDSKVEYQEKGADPLYGIAVGFAEKSGVAKLAKLIFKGEKLAKINPGASFIYIAPYEEVGSLCRVI
nr:hypothetical protein [Nanoarchaeota archaeon]